LTPRLAKKLVQCIKQTGRIEPAARRCGVAQNTVNDWVERGQGRHPTRKAAPVFVDFAIAVEKALADFEVSRLKGIETAIAIKPENWQAYAWQLERWAPDRYGRRDHVEVSGTLTVVEMRAFFVAVMQLMERYVPAERREAEARNLIAVVDELAGGVARPHAVSRAS
jgi:hypothetical protein